MRKVPVGTKKTTICLLLWAICLLGGVTGGALPARAQLSPGKLSRPHAELEGLTRCSSCHKLGSREVTAKCLECHTEIAAMAQAGKGLHAGPDHANCVDCHVEHHGQDYDLVFWEGGQEAFGHQVTGFALEGKHAELACRKCHTPQHVARAAELRARSKDLNRTFLGLDPACVSCHTDVHRGQFEKACTECHDTTAWKPAPRFDHAATPFPLTGKHVKVDCARCHKPEPAAAGAEPVVRFAPVAHGACTDCHKDAHSGNLGPNCTGCHVADGWKLIQGEGFDHSRTRYPLQGRHAQVSCAQCHGQGRPKPAFAACRDCHRDEHAGKTSRRPRLLECENCHTVDGFRPSTFTVTQHQQGTFPLQGAHLATPCLACHRPQTEKPAALILDHQTCTACHQDPHQGRMDRLSPAPDQGCAACHGQDSWRIDRFDHTRTGFPLEGRHAAAACAACHKPGRKGDFTGLATACAACHQDVHQGQFATRKTPDGAQIDCAVCHVTVDWFAEKFDHEKDSRFPLRGGHEQVACNRCHRPVNPDNERLLKFKPLPVDCKDCHAGTVPVSGSKE